MADDLLFVGITGGIASGKSEFAAEIERLGGFIIDADKIAADIVRPGSPANEKIASHFGDSILCGNGMIDRKALADIVFTDPTAREMLEEITHPIIMDEMVAAARVFNEKRRDEPRVVIIDAPLIIDTGVAGIFDFVIVVWADEDTRVRRLIERKGYSEEEARSRIRSQVSDNIRIKKADIIIQNNEGLDSLKAKAEDVWLGLVKRAAS